MDVYTYAQYVCMHVQDLTFMHLWEYVLVSVCKYVCKFYYVMYVNIYEGPYMYVCMSSS